MSTPNFSRGAQKGYSGGGGFALAAMPLAQKRDLARQLLGEFGVTKVTERGDELIHSCCLPFGGHRHGDANPSASLNYAKLTYNCLGCGNSGGLLWFIGVCRGEDTDRSRQWLEVQLGHDDSDEGVANLLAWIDAMYSSENVAAVQTIPRMSASVLQPWLKLHPWVTETRHIPAKVAMQFQVGFGEFRVPLENERWVTSDRIVLPHFWRGDLVGWQTRRLTDDGTPKYLSSSDFPKDLTIFNHHPKDSVVVVESMMSVLSKYHLDPRIEATFGAKVTDRQISLLAGHRSTILWFDNDDAGWAATKRVGDALLAYHPVWVVPCPYAADVGDLDEATYLDLLDKRIPYALWTPPEELVPWGREVAHVE